MPSLPCRRPDPRRAVLSLLCATTALATVAAERLGDEDDAAGAMGAVDASESPTIPGYTTEHSAFNFEKFCDNEHVGVGADFPAGALDASPLGQGTRHILELGALCATQNFLHRARGNRTTPAQFLDEARARCYSRSQDYKREPSVWFRYDPDYAAACETCRAHRCMGEPLRYKRAETFDSTALRLAETGLPANDPRSLLPKDVTLADILAGNDTSLVAAVADALSFGQRVQFRREDATMDFQTYTEQTEAEFFEEYRSYESYLSDFGRPVYHLGEPPVSDYHRSIWAAWGDYAYLPPARYLHNLEHGGVVVLYDACGGSELRASLRHYLQTSPLLKARGIEKRWILTPFQGLGKAAAILVWGAGMMTDCIEGFRDVPTDDGVRRGAELPADVRAEFDRFLTYYHGFAPEDLPQDGKYTFGLDASSTAPAEIVDKALGGDMAPKCDRRDNPLNVDRPKGPGTTRSCPGALMTWSLYAVHLLTAMFVAGMAYLKAIAERDNAKELRRAAGALFWRPPRARVASDADL